LRALFEAAHLDRPFSGGILSHFSLLMTSIRAGTPFAHGVCKWPMGFGRMEYPGVMS
jgi:hypothetical protein